MTRTAVILGSLLMATTLFAQQQTSTAQQTTTTVNRGDQNTSINAQATGRRPANQLQQTTTGTTSEIPSPAEPRTPFVDVPRSTTTSQIQRRAPTMSAQD